MRPRHLARELAVRVLFQLELRPGPWRPPLEYQLGQEPDVGAARQFAAELVEGTVLHLAEIDAAIAACSTHWALDQMGALERAVLRVAAEELCWRRQEPVAVVIDEAVRLAKQMAGEDASRFVNGVLGNLARTAQVAPEGAGASSPGR
ncbi:MAG: transcription antitermination factor NusB [Candidatus Dormibacteria bacterium]